MTEIATLVDLVRARAQDRGARAAFHWLVEGEAIGAPLTYTALDRQARAVAGLLQTRCSPGQRALLLYPPGLEFVTAFFGCVYAGVVPVPAYPPEPGRLTRTLPRLRAIARDAGATLVLTTAEVIPMASALAMAAPDLARLPWLACDHVDASLADDWHDPNAGRDTIAFLQYTSGSTAAPKGVVVTHRNLLHNEEMIRQVFQQGEDAVGVSWLPLYHDMGLIGHVVHPIYIGATQYLMSPLAFLQRPARWLQAISRVRASISGAPNFGYDLAVRRVSDEQLATLDLSSWTLAFNGAEPVRHDTLQRFAARFAPAGFRWASFSPCYGLAEATLAVTGSHHGVRPRTLSVDAAELERHRVVECDDGRTLIGCGPAAESVAIVDVGRGVRCSSDQVGEIWVRGPHVASGYWNQPALSAEVFGGQLEHEHGVFLRTGDLGFVHDGELFVTGRIKDVIIVAGRNHYPQDLELTVEGCHPSLRAGGAAAFSVDVDGQEALVIAVESRDGPDADDVVRTVRRAIVEAHNVAVHAVILVPPRSLPKTSSGKLQRHLCRAACLADELDTLRA